MAMADGYTQRESYIIAYEPNTENIASIDTMAWKIARREDIQDRIAELRNRKAEKSQYTDINDINKRYALIWERIEACKQKGDDAGISRYMEIINKMTGTYVNITKDISEDKTIISDLSTNDLKKLLDNESKELERTTIN